MRIIGGKLGGRTFEAPKGHKTHPMSERVRGALFNKLGDIEGLSALDAYAGSGALGFEALSRGAGKVQMVDNDKQACSIMKLTANKLGLSPDIVKISQANIASWAQRNQNSKFDLIFCDPPFGELNLHHFSLLIQHLKSKGLMVLSYPGRESTPTVNGVVVVDNQSYGDAALAFYRLAS